MELHVLVLTKYFYECKICGLSWRHLYTGFMYMRREQMVVGVVLALIAAAAIYLLTTRKVGFDSSFIASVPLGVKATGCDESLWQSNAEAERVSERCVYITGTVVETHPEDDGEMHIDIKVDDAFKSLLNQHNLQEGKGVIGVEPICVVKPKKKEKAFIKACEGFINTVYLPKVGEHIGVLGAYTQDKHLWMEIHPVTKIDKL